MDLIVLKGSLKLPRAQPSQVGKMVRRGEVVPPHSLPPEEVQRLLKAGIVGPRVAPVVEKGGLPPTRGKWCRDPASLAGLSVMQLLSIVTEIDPDFAGGEELGESALVQLLTADFDQAFRLPEPPAATDKLRPSAPALERARARAKGA